MGCNVLDANLDNSLANLYRFRHPALSDTKVCEHIIEEAEKFAMTNGGWTTQRHKAYPTTDIPVAKIKPLEHVFERVRQAVIPFIEKVHTIPGDKKWHFNDLFVVKYEWAPGKQFNLAKHQDGSSFSFTVLLNPKTDFEGGGTYYEAYDKVIQPDQGDILVHAGSMRHEGRPISKGVRYLMIGFLALKDDCYAGGLYEDRMMPLHNLIARGQKDASIAYAQREIPLLQQHKNSDNDNGHYQG
mmetsp:Transcript_94356/g.163110  ORF Transcript_94356/g.163110 Transcript_94356/m.163110 type:complete len:242 (-) Transcript_94356:407-1132(-)